MGNASSLFDGSYEVEEAFPELTSSDGERKQGWTLQLAEDSSGRRVSIFLYPTDATNVEYVDNAVKHFKMLRHPGIPKFLDTKRHATGCMIVTEKIIPLESLLQQLTPSEICAGLYNIVEVLAFLHDRGGVCHNNICLSSIFVGSNGRWMLGGLEYMCRFDEATATYLNKCKSLRNQNSLAPEEKDGRVQVQTKHGHARDIYAFGVLAENLLTYLDDLGDSTKTFELRIQDELLNRDPSVRPCVSTLLADRLFKIDYLEIINFLRDITLKTEDEKKSFFSDAARKLYSLPSTLITTRLVRPLLSRFVLLDSTATTCLIPHLLTPYKGSRESDDFKDNCVNPLLPEESFQRYVIPELFRVFHVYNVHIRLTLLRHFESYVHLFDADTLRDFIFPQILVGLRDSCDELVAASLRAVACLVPILGGNVVMGAKREKLFSGTTPDFSDNRNHVQKIDSDVTEKSNSNGMIGNRADDIADPKEERRKLREQQREDRRRHREEKEKNLAKASPKQMKDDEECLNELHTSDSICSSLEGEQSHDAVEEDTTDSDDAVADYDKEIEEELEAMDSGVAPRRDHDIVTGPAVTVDWSDIKTTPTRTKNHGSDEKGALRLKSHRGDDSVIGALSKDSASKSGHAKDSDAEISDVGTGWSDATDEGWDTTENWEDVSTTSQHPSTHVSPAKLSYPLKSKDKQPGRKLSPSKLCPDAALGAEFDVMAIEVPRKTKSATVDPIEQLFAEMQPTIASSGGGLLGMLCNSGSRSVVQSQTDDKYKKKASSLFAANDIPDADSDGWGTDLNWNIPDD